MANTHCVFLLGLLCIMSGYGEKLWYTHKNYTAKSQGTPNITADSIPSTNFTLDLTDNPAMRDGLGNKHVFSNQSTTNTTNNSFDSTAVVGIVISVAAAAVICIVVIVVLQRLRKSKKEKGTYQGTQEQDIRLMEP